MHINQINLPGVIKSFLYETSSREVFTSILVKFLNDLPFAHVVGFLPSFPRGFDTTGCGGRRGDGGGGGGCSNGGGGAACGIETNFSEFSFRL